MIRIVLFIITIFYSSSSTAQTTVIGAEIAAATDLVHVNDPAARMNKPDLSAAFAGIKVRHIVADPLFLETGLYTRIYREGYAFNSGSASITGRRTFMLPLRAGLRIPLLNKKLFVNPVAGYVLGLADDQEAGSGWGQTVDPYDRIDFEYDMTYPVQAFSMLQGGLSIELRIFKKAFLSLSGNYYHGLDKLWVQKMRYTVEGDIQRSATSYSKGSFYGVGIGFNYPIGLSN